MAEQQIPSFEADVLTLKTRQGDPAHPPAPTRDGPGTTALLESPPALAVAGETDMEFYRRKQNRVAIRSSTDDELVAVIEIVSAANKSGRRAVEQFVEKAAALLQSDVHLMLLDVQPRTPRDPDGIHGVLWEYVAGEAYAAPAGKPFTFASYEAGPRIRAYVQHAAVAEPLPEMPLFLKPGGHIPLALESMYQAAYANVPGRWRAVLEE
jgi:hypothetical protein